MRLKLILFLQQFHFLDSFAEAITLLGDPVYSLLIIIPVFFWLIDNRLGCKAIVAWLASDIVNAALKWPLAGHRPYWVDERVREFFITCESGFGNPSGHSMVSAGVLVVASLHLRNRYFSLGSAILIGLIGVSRMHVGAHFIEQIVLGICFGYGIGWFIHSKYSEIANTISSSVGHDKLALIVPLASLVFIMGEYQLLNWAGFEPDASLELARKGCDLGPAGLHNTTSPFMGIFRDTGVMTLFGLYLVYRKHYAHAIVCKAEGSNTHRVGLRLLRFIVGIAIVLAANRLCANAVKQMVLVSDHLGCVGAFCHFFIVMFCVLVVVPWMFIKTGLAAAQK